MDVQRVAMMLPLAPQRGNDHRVKLIELGNQVLEINDLFVL